MRILVTDGMDASAVAKLRADGFEVVEQFYEPDELGAALREFDVVIIRSATKIKEPQIDAAKGGKLKVIIRAGVGVDNIAVKYAEENGFVVKNTPRASSNAVAELAIALLFACARNISIAGHTMREKKWEKKAYSKGFEVSGKVVGVIGYGRIGQMVGQKCQALETMAALPLQGTDKANDQAGGNALFTAVRVNGNVHHIRLSQHCLGAHIAYNPLCVHGNQPERKLILQF